jgi:Winged helix DNA-binding domain
LSSAAPNGLEVGRERVMAYRLRANNLHDRLPAGSLVEAARYALQDTVPRSGLLSLHARVGAVEPSAWEAPALVQIWSPRTAVHIVPAVDVAVFTLGRLPRETAAAGAIENAAREVSRALAGRERPKREVMPALGGRPAHRALFRAALTGRFLIRWDTRDTLVREVPAPEADPEAARLELCRRHLRAFGPSTPQAFAWWAGVEPVEARRTWRALAAELVPVEADGLPAWVLRRDLPDLASAEPVTGVRFLPPEELKLFGQDRTGLFAGPGQAGPRPPFDWHHGGGLLVAGRLVGAWGRHSGRVDVRLFEPLDRPATAAVEAEARSFPIPGALMSVQIH